MTLDDRLTKIFAYGIDWTEYKDKSEYDHDTSMFAAKIKAQHKKALEQAILSDLLEIIEENCIYEGSLEIRYELLIAAKEYCK